MGKLHVVFFPFMAHGHMIPTLDMAKLFSSRGVKTTIITTPLNAPFFSKSIHRSNQLGLEISLKIFDFPAVAAGLPESYENTVQLTSEEMFPKFLVATALLREPVEQLPSDHSPDLFSCRQELPLGDEGGGEIRHSEANFPRVMFLCALRQGGSEEVQAFTPVNCKSH